MDELSQFEKVEQYVLGKMTPEEVSAFEHSLETDAELYKSVQRKRMLLGSIKMAHEEGLKSKISAIQERTSVDLGQNSELRTGKFRKLTSVLAIAASILLIILAFWYLMPRSDQQLARQYFNPYPDVLSQRLEEKGFFGSHESETYLKSGMTEYNTQDYISSTSSLTSYIDQAPSEHPFLSEGKLYLALSYFQLQNYPESTNILLQLDESSNPEMSNVIDWYLGLSYLAEGKRAEAKIKLAALRNDDKYSARAEALLEVF